MPLHHVILPKGLLYSYELNTLDACWIAVDVWSNSSRCRIVSVYLSRTWWLYTIFMLRQSHNYSLFYQLLDGNLFTRRRIPLSGGKPLEKTMAPGSIFIILLFRQLANFCRRCLFAFFTFCFYIKNIILSYLSDLTFVSDHEGIDNPFIALVVRSLFVCVGMRLLARGLLLDWYLGSKKLREILTLLWCISLSSSREYNASSRRSKVQQIIFVFFV